MTICALSTAKGMDFSVNAVTQHLYICGAAYSRIGRSPDTSCQENRPLDTLKQRVRRTVPLARDNVSGEPSP